MSFLKYVKWKEEREKVRESERERERERVADRVRVHNQHANRKIIS